DYYCYSTNLSDNLGLF
nr:immunoglobulin light chain junction region [Macaca mulatta]MOW31705.1 immunoglobulin light chain junction region [Macaca mulatta]MOW32007.1 immunoglobulin light chain junction region [Macaca mulatta]